MVSHHSSSRCPRILENIRRVIRQVQKQSNLLQRTVLLEITCEETTGLQVDTHSRKHNREIVVVTIVNTLVVSRSLDKTSLTTDLCGDFIMRQTSSREDGDFLTTSYIT